MAEDVPLEARIPVALDRKLARLAAERGKSKSALVLEALATFVVTEEEFAAAVAQGLAEADAGELIDHEEVMREADALLARKR